jgi:hypothetical protein
MELMAFGAIHLISHKKSLKRKQSVRSFKAQEKSVPAIASRVVDASIWTNHPSGEYMTEETLKNVTLADVLPTTKLFRP